jgi:predicted alpha/beta superfamily hydrolase
MRHHFNLPLFIIIVFLINTVVDAQNTSQANSDNHPPYRYNAYKIPRSEVIPIQNSKNGRQYSLYIRLPDGYGENPEVKHPVIYSTDAAWHMEMLAGSSEYLVPNAIIVGISWQQKLDDDREHISRFWDYSFLKSTNPETQAKYNLGQASNHLTFIQDDVINYINSHYDTKPAENTYFGYSLGGTFGAYILTKAPNTFKYYILGSPEIDERELQYIKDYKIDTSPFSANAYVTIGALEVEKMTIIKDFMITLQSRKGQGLTTENLNIIKGTDHTSAFPVTTTDAFRWLAQKLDENDD